MTTPATKAARLEQVARILDGHAVRSQEELATLLSERGIHVTQATLSRDLEELGAVRLRRPGTGLVYALPGEPGGPGSHPGGTGGPAGPAPASTGNGGLPRGSLARVASDLLVSAEASANLVVLRTPAGGAQLLASAIDHAEWPSVLGTVAGDDTVLVISRDPAGGGDLAQALLHLAEHRAT